MSYEPSARDFPAERGAGQDIEELLDGLARLAASDLPAHTFHESLLQGAVRGLAAAGGAVWFRDGAGQIRLEAQLHLGALVLAENWADAQRHTQLLSAVLASGECTLAPPRTALPGNPQALNPSEYLLLLAPIAADHGAGGLIEVFQRGEVTPAAHDGHLRFLAAVADLAGEYQRNLEWRELREREALWSQFERFDEQLHRRLESAAVAYTIVNDGRALCGCDRLSVAIARGRRLRIAAVTGLDQLDRRAQTVRCLEQLADAVLQNGEPVWYADGSTELSPQIDTPLHNLLDETHARAVAIVPLTAAASDEPPADDAADASSKRKTLGVLIVERFDGAPFDPPQRQRIAAVARHGAIALHNAATYESVPLLPLWRMLGKVGWLARARQLPKTALALAAVGAVVAALILIPADFDISARGQLQPEMRREVFARSDGIIDKIYVKHGDAVKDEELLATLRKPQLAFESGRLAGEITTAQSKLDSIRAARLAAGESPSEKQNDKFNQLTAEEEEVKAQLAGLKRQEEILKLQQTDLELRSPMAGAVITWNIEELLAARPVARGQDLLTVANLKGDWVLEVEVPDYRIGHVLAAQEEQRAENKSDALPASFILATEPGAPHAGNIERVALAAETEKTDKASGAAVLVTVSIKDRSAIPLDELRPGATAVVKIHCGRRSLGYVWLHELWETVQSRVLF